MTSDHDEQPRDDVGGDTGRHPPPPVRKPTQRHLVIPVRRLVIGVFAVVAAVAVAGFGWLAFDHHQRNVAAARALDAATAYALTLCNIEAATVDESLDDLKRHTTDKLNAMHAKDADRIRRIIIEKKVVAHGEIVNATVTSATRNRVEVVLIVDQTIADTENPHPDTERSRVKLTMERVGDRWLASGVEL